MTMLNHMLSSVCLAFKSISSAMYMYMYTPRNNNSDVRVHVRVHMHFFMLDKMTPFACLYEQYHLCVQAVECYA